MSSDSPSPVRAQVCCAVVVVGCVGLSALLSGVGHRDEHPGGVAVEVNHGGAVGRVMLFDEAPDVCEALDVAGVMIAGCVGKGRLQSGAALFVMPDGHVREGRMSGQGLLALGLPVPVNAASAEDLEAINGIGPSLARAIVVDRMRAGPFGSARDLDRVKGIGPKKAAVIDRYVSYSPWPSVEVQPLQ